MYCTIFLVSALVSKDIPTGDNSVIEESQHDRYYRSLDTAVALLTLVTLKQACSSCAIVESLVRESVSRVQAATADLQFDVVLVGSPEEIEAVSHLEVERFPALILDGEQITAGSIITPKQLLELLLEHGSTT